VTPLEEAVDDYVESCERLFPFADYLVVNVSSPNTPDLRKLQEADRLQRLLEALIMANRRLAVQRQTYLKPVLVKIAPDLSDEEVVTIAQVAHTTGAAGLIATNTTIARPPTLRTAIREDGGLSGKPLALRALEVLRLLFRTVDGKLPLIGVGGIFSAEDAYTRIRAGASLVQVYTGLIYEGPFLPRRIVRGLRFLLMRDNCRHLRDAIGKDV
jgi:dihydroorotate dehydrogenase